MQTSILGGLKLGGGYILKNSYIGAKTGENIDYQDFSSQSFFIKCCTPYTKISKKSDSKFQDGGHFSKWLQNPSQDVSCCEYTMNFYG